MGETVDMRVLAKTVANYGFAYLITIADGDRIHTSVVHPTVGVESLTMAAPSSRVQANTKQRPKVSLVWPPREPNGYSLIVDGVAELDDSTLRVVCHPRNPASTRNHRCAGWPGLPRRLHRDLSQRVGLPRFWLPSW